MEDEYSDQFCKLYIYIRHHFTAKTTGTIILQLLLCLLGMLFGTIWNAQHTQKNFTSRSTSTMTVSNIYFYSSLVPLQLQRLLLHSTLLMLTPVSPWTVFGSLSMTSMTSPVNLDAPTSPLPIDTILTDFAWASGAAISAATYKQTTQITATMTTTTTNTSTTTSTTATTVTTRAYYHYHHSCQLIPL